MPPHNWSGPWPRCHTWSTIDADKLDEVLVMWKPGKGGCWNALKKKTLKQMVWLLCISVALTACKEKPEIIEAVRAIKTITVSEQAAEQIRKFSGLVAAVDSSDLSFQVGGQVASVKVDIGDRVKKGQVLAVLDPEPYQLDVDAIKAELVKARDNVTKSKAEYERQKRIYEQGAGAKSYLDVAEYNYKAAKSAVNYQMARLDLAKRNLRKTKLLSPYDGTIAWRSVQPHEEVQVGQKVFEINATGENGSTAGRSGDHHRPDTHR